MTAHRTQATRDLVEGVLRGDPGATARVITLVENRSQEIPAIYEGIFPRTGRAYRIGLTGPPGGGKSTLADGMARVLHGEGRRPAVVAVDPSSPFTGGALLGDRIRMRGLPDEVFVRSMASRGEFGGLARATAGACDVLDAAGADPILLETVGVGQSEVDVAGAADTTVVVLCPGGGDGVQLLKAGVLEAADVLVVNKSDLDGAQSLAEELEGYLEIRGGEHGAWTPPVVRAEARDGTGIREVLDAAARHRARLEASGGLEARRKRRVERAIRAVVEERMHRSLWEDAGVLRELARLVERVHARGETPYEAAARIAARLKGGA